MNPLISVIIPVYNVESYLRECIDSVLKQTYKNLEIILVDDGSPDGCPQICEEYAHLDERIVVVHKENGGLSTARNAGLEVASGEYISFIDSDDFIEYNMFQRLFDAQNKTNADVVGCGIMRYVSGKNREVSVDSDEMRVYDSQSIIKDILKLRMDNASWNKLYKRSVIGSLRFIPGRYNEDFPFIFFLYQKCKKIVYLKQGFYHYRLNPNGVTQTFSSKSIDTVINAFEIQKYVYQYQLPYKREADLYTIKRSISVARRISEFNAIEEFHCVYDKCMMEIKRNLFKVIFCMSIGPRSKCWSLFLLAKYSIWHQ